MKNGKNISAGLLIAVFILTALAAGCGPKEKPTEEEVKDISIEILNDGWVWLEAKNMTVLSMKPTGKADCQVTFAYVLIAKKSSNELTEAEMAHYKKFLPECAAKPLPAGGECRQIETMLFTKDERFGWAPQLLLEVNPGYLENYKAQRPKAD